MEKPTLRNECRLIHVEINDDHIIFFYTTVHIPWQNKMFLRALMFLDSLPVWYNKSNEFN